MSKTKSKKSKTVLIIPASRGAEVRLDLGCGQTPKPGFEGVDLYSEEAKHRFDLLTFPWPFADSSVDEIYCAHFIEHIPMEVRNGKDLLLAFFDEVYRVLKPRGKAEFIWPNLKSVRAFQDPTHRRFIPTEVLYYLHRPWREANKLTHGLYDVAADFDFSINPGLTPEVRERLELDALHLRAPEVQVRTNHRMQEGWDLISDWQAILVSRKAP